MRVHIYLWCNTNKANRIPWSSVCLRVPHGKWHGSSCNLQGMMDWKSNDIFRSYLGNIILRNKRSQGLYLRKMFITMQQWMYQFTKEFHKFEYEYSLGSPLEWTQGFLEKRIFSILYTVNIIMLYVILLKSSEKLNTLYFIFSKP